MNAELEAIDLPVLQRFQELYRQNWPKYCQEYYCLDNFIEFLRKEPEIKHLQLYTLSAKQASDEGLFVIVVSSL